MPTYIPGISATGSLAPGLTPAAVRAVLELLSAAEIAAAYLPLAGGTMAGNLDMDHYQISNVQAIDSDEITLNGLPVASEQYASSASNLSTGTVPDARLSANVPLKNAANTFTAAQSIQGIITSDNASGGLHIVNSAMRVVKNGATLLIENQSTAWPIDLSHPLNGFTNVVAAQGGLPTLGFSLTRSNNNPDVRVVRNATGPTLETRAAGGLKVCNADGSAVGPVQCSTVSVLVSTGLSGVVIGNSLSTQSGVGFYSSGTRMALYADNAVAMFLGNGTNICANGRPLVFSQDASGLGNTRISEASAGVLQIGTTSNNASGSLNLANLTASGAITSGTTNAIVLNGVASGIDYVNAQLGQWNLRSDNTGKLKVGRSNGGNTYFYDNGLFVNAITGLNSITLPLTSLAARPLTIGQQAMYSDQANGDFVLYDNINSREYLRVKRDTGEFQFVANLTASGGITFGPRTKSALLATSATATAGVWRITDSTPPGRLAYPDGTSWRYMSDDTVVI